MRWVLSNKKWIWETAHNVTIMTNFIILDRKIMKFKNDENSPELVLFSGKVTH